jgi:hypothetical protein
MRHYLIILILGVFTLGSFTQCTGVQKQKWEQKRRTKKFEKEKQRRFEEDAEAYRKARERHLDIQSGKAKREMKKNQRLSQRHNSGRREFFLVRWYNKQKVKSRQRRNTRH